MPDRLQRSTTNRVWTGVAGGIAEYFQIDPTLVRVLFVIATILTGGLFFIVYIALIVLMPLPGQRGPFDSSTTTPPASGTATDPASSSSLTPSSMPYRHSPEAAARRREGAGWLLVALGVVFLLANAGAFRFVDFRYIWPIALIALGAFIVLQRSRP